MSILHYTKTKWFSKMPHQKALSGFDPIPFWKQISIPVFLGFGGEDTNVPVTDCLKRLNENDLSSFQTKVYANGGHAILDTETTKVNEKYLNDLVNFIKKQPIK